MKERKKGRGKKRVQRCGTEYQKQRIRRSRKEKTKAEDIDHFFVTPTWEKGMQKA